MSCICEFANNLMSMRSPFRRLVATDYYDGSTAGLIECDRCQRLFRFETIDWDDEQNMRIFTLARIPNRSLEELGPFRGVSSTRQEWILRPLRDAEIIRVVDEMMAHALPPKLIIATLDLLGRLNCFCEGMQSDEADWFQAFNLSRRPTA